MREKVAQIRSEKHKGCLFPECEREVCARGLCKIHYTSAARYVRRGGTTWEKLESAGKVLPSKGKGTRTTRNALWFTGES